MGEAGGLLLDGGHHLGVGVPHVHHPDAPGEVQIAFAVQAPDLGALSLVGEVRVCVADALGDGQGPAFG